MVKKCGLVVDEETVLIDELMKHCEGKHEGEPLSSTLQWSHILKNINLHDAMFYIFDKKKIGRLVTKAKVVDEVVKKADDDDTVVDTVVDASGKYEEDHKYFGPTFTTNGIQLNLQVISGTVMNNNDRKQLNFRNKKFQNKEEKDNEDGM